MKRSFVTQWLKNQRQHLPISNLTCKDSSTSTKSSLSASSGDQCTFIEELLKIFINSNSTPKIRIYLDWMSVFLPLDPMDDFDCLSESDKVERLKVCLRDFSNKFNSNLGISIARKELLELISVLASRLHHNASLKVCKDPLFEYSCKVLFYRLMCFWILCERSGCGTAGILEYQKSVLRFFVISLDILSGFEDKRDLSLLEEILLSSLCQNIQRLEGPLLFRSVSVDAATSGTGKTLRKTLKQQEIIMTDFLENGMGLLKALQKPQQSKELEALVKKQKFLLVQLIPLLEDHCSKESTFLADEYEKFKRVSAEFEAFPYNCNYYQCDEKGHQVVSALSKIVMDILGCSKNLIKRIVKIQRSKCVSISSTLPVVPADPSPVDSPMDSEKSFYATAHQNDSDLNFDDTFGDLTLTTGDECSPVESAGKNPMKRYYTAAAALKSTFFTADLSLLKRKESLRTLTCLPSTLRYGTVQRLIERLTFIPKPMGSNGGGDLNHFTYQKSLIVSHYNFTDSKSLLSMIIERFRCRFEAPGLSSGHVVSSIRLHSLHLLRVWLEMQPQDFNDANLSTSLREFIEDEVRLSFPRAAATLAKCLVTGNSPRSYNNNNNNTVIPPNPILPKQDCNSINGNNSFILDIDPLEIARQMTLIDEKIFQKVRFRDFFSNQGGDKEQEEEEEEEESAVESLVKRFNFITQWVISVILSCSGAKDRAMLLRLFISVAERLFHLRNYHGLKAIIGSLTSAPVFRLKESWSLVPRKFVSLLEELERVVSADDNYHRFRLFLNEAAASHGPCIPWLGLYLKDVVFIQDAQKTYLDTKGDHCDDKMVINFTKCQMLLPIMQAISDFQKHPYPFIQIPVIQDFLTKDWGVWKSDQDQYNRSLLVEPKHATM